MTVEGSTLFSAVLFAHILNVLLMAAPYYNLVVVNERAKFGKSHIDTDRYVEKMIRTNAIRCYVFQIVALITGLLLVFLHEPLLSIFNWWLLAKISLLFVLMGLLSMVHFNIQPKIDSLIARVKKETIPKEIMEKIMPLRALRKKMAATCFFLVVVIILIAIVNEIAILLVPLIPLSAILAYAVYKRGAPFGYI